MHVSITTRICSKSAGSGAEEGKLHRSDCGFVVTAVTIKSRVAGTKPTFHPSHFNAGHAQFISDCIGFLPTLSQLDVFLAPRRLKKVALGSRRHLHDAPVTRDILLCISG